MKHKIESDMNLEETNRQVIDRFVEFVNCGDEP